MRAFPLRGVQVSKCILNLHYAVPQDFFFRFLSENGLFGLIEQYMPQDKKDDVARELSSKLVELDSAYNSGTNHQP